MPLEASVLAAGLNSPGSYVHWNVFNISYANLGMIIGMLELFFAALLAPFPGDHAVDLEPPDTSQKPVPPGTGRLDGTWAGGIRKWALRNFPPDRLLPDRQPGYVASWVYVFGVGSLAAFFMAIVSGFAIALGGVDWWHTSPVGHFFNSLHLWSVEMFMAFMVIHLWGKFFMAAWRGGRARTWITGVIAFMASIIEAFTGYLSQSNFDAQWISTNGKDAFNATGLGGFFNLMNSGQMLLWHVVLMPVVLVTLVGLHILLVRHRGVVHPFPARRGRDALGQLSADGAPVLSTKELRKADAREWRGPYRRYDIIREGVAAVVVVGLLVVLLGGALSSPDVPAVTIQKWASVAPGDFLATVADELSGQSETAGYGPPYNSANGSTQTIIISWEKLAGVREHVDAAKAFVLAPLTTFSATDPALAAALAKYDAASGDQQQKWLTNYSNGLNKVTMVNGQPQLPAGDYGPLTLMFDSELTMARSGGLDASLLSGHPFYGTNYTQPLLFLEDGTYFGALAQAQNLEGNQWGVMNETGSYPGQPWLWLYQLWYNLPGFRSSANVDLIAIYLTGLATILLLAIPFIPGLREVPRKVKVYRLIWRKYYQETESPALTGPGGDEAPAKEGAGVSPL